MKLIPVKPKILKRLVATAGFAVCTLANTVTAEVIDVLVLYTPEALQTRNGADIDARISSYITYSNDAYSNAQVDMQLRLVGSALLDADYDYVNETNLSNLRRNSTVANLRREHGADAVVLLNLRQQVSNGYICGIGYVPSGDSGRLYSNAASVAYSLVGIDCGVNTFTHEVGHNMSLGHSYVQGSTGGVWPWARGHGVQGLFSTIMAYPHAYGTYRQLPVFSNPRINSCEGQACGVDQAQNNGADAAANLTALASQIAGFMPTVHDIDDGDDGGDDDGNGDDDTPPSDTPCVKDPVVGNLLINGEFDSNTDGWQSGFGESTLSITALQAEDCLDNALVVGNRTQYYSSAFQSTNGKLTVGNSYQFNGKFGIANGSRESIRVALRIRSYWGSRYAYLDPVSVTANELTSYQQSFTLSSGEVDGILIYGPAAGVDIVMDSLSIVPLNSAASAVDRLDELAAAEQVLNEQFELKANGWQSFHGGRLSYTADASTGKYSLRASKRKSEYAGPALDATGALQAGSRYQLNASVKVMGATSQQTVQAWLFYVDNSGGHWQKLAIASAPVGAWQPLEGQFTIDADGDISRARLHILGPEANHSLQLDNLIIERL